MAFMEPDTYHGDYYEVESKAGTTFIPVDVHRNAKTNADLRNYVEGDLYQPDEEPLVKTGWLGRLSAAGYMDATEWSPYEGGSHDEVVKAICEDQDLCETCFEQHDEDEPCEKR